jgi:threonine dehydrogenase-like Zn-dependent dehydrogenase
MRQLTLTAVRKPEWTEVPEPELHGPNEALVRPLAVALCDLDQPIIHGQVPAETPMALGHEGVAEVVATGDEVTGVAVGDWVIVPFQISCGECEHCRRGLTATCTTTPHRATYGLGALGGHEWGGLLAELVRVPYADHMLARLPDGVAPAAVASFSDNVPDAWRAVAPGLREWPGADVLVMGGGARSIGLYAAALARALGAGEVVYADTDAERLAAAEAVGATPLEGPPPKRAGSFPVTVDAAVDGDGLACALRSTAPHGICTSATVHFEPETPIPLLEMYDRCCSFHTGRCNARPPLEELLGLVTDGRFHPAAITTHVAPWDDAPEAVLEPQTKLVLERGAGA